MNAQGFAKSVFVHVQFRGLDFKVYVQAIYYHTRHLRGTSLPGIEPHQTLAVHYLHNMPLSRCSSLSCQTVFPEHEHTVLSSAGEHDQHCARLGLAPRP